MPVTNAEIAAELEKLADLLEIEGANNFRVRAYRQAARLVGSLGRNVAEMVAAGETLEGQPGIGADLAGKIATLARGEKLPLLAELTAKNPAGITALLDLPGLGPKRVHQLRESLGIDSIAKLRAAVYAGKLSSVPGFGPGIIDRLKQALAKGAGAKPRMLLATADQIAAPLLATVRKAKGVSAAEIAGSCRRRRETVGDLDIVICAADPGPVMAAFTGYEDVKEVLEQGSTRASIVLRSDLQVDLRVVDAESYGSALLYFTGSKPHSIKLRQIALDRKLKLNEYGLFRGTRRVAGKTEEEVYEKLGLPLIPPELREAEGEIEAARAHHLPRLVTVEDMRGDLHSHTDATDGRAPLATMAQAAKSRGYAYYAVTDHSRRMTMAHGLDAKRLGRQIDAIARLNRELDGFTVLAGIEVDILEDGTLDLPDDILRRLDIVVGSIHTSFNLPAEKQTERLLRAMDNPLLNIIGHPTGRLINQRDSYAIDMERVIRGAKERGCHLEVNANPERLDLDAHYCRFAKEIGVKLAISTDSHDPSHFAFMRYGVDQARRGWIEPKDVINTRPLGELRKLLKRT
ncbi:MAG TPA: DNA polymerase/3'-5' exonuclease PolX [Acetobacteraceae bacterium]|nr:DNA polymerase/3'-5' exonuclease PolX [Acetobacteraceae bacterium]